MKKFLFISSAAIAAAVLLVLAVAFPYPPSQAQTTVNGRKDGFNCVVAVSTATTLQDVGGACLAPAGDRAIYITDIEFGSSAAGSTAADSFPTLKQGTATACATNPIVIWQGMITANGQIEATLTTPIHVTKGNNVCWIMSTAGSKTIQIHGFYGAQE